MDEGDGDRERERRKKGKMAAEEGTRGRGLRNGAGWGGKRGVCKSGGYRAGRGYGGEAGGTIRELLSDEMMIENTESVLIPSTHLL